MEKLTEVISTVSSYITFPLLFVLLVSTGIIFSVYLGFPQVSKMGRGLKDTFGGLFKKKESDESSMSSFQALATAIAAQVGTGNVAGVATAIMMGGPGAIFWMWVSAFLGMGTIFAEAVLAQKYREKRDGEYVGGPAYYLSRGLSGMGKPGLGKFLAGFFSVAIIIALGFVGNLVQSNSISSAVNKATGLNPLMIGIIIAVCAALVFMGGMKRIASFAELVVPFMALLYIAGALVIMIMFRGHIIPALREIFVGAFNPAALGGGITGATVAAAMRFGVSRGLFSNEAGMGSTPHAHAVADVKHPVEQGLVAIVGVLIDTIVVCTATAMIVLVTKSNEAPGLAGALVTQNAFQVAFGPAGSVFLAVCLSFFAFTTIVGWYYFGETNIKYLFGRKGLLPYRFIVIVFIIIGSMLTREVDLVWLTADLFNGIMVFPNLIGLLFLASQVKKLLTGFNRGEPYVKRDAVVTEKETITIE